MFIFKVTFTFKMTQHFNLFAKKYLNSCSCCYKIMYHQAIRNTILTNTMINVHAFMHLTTLSKSSSRLLVTTRRPWISVSKPNRSSHGWRQICDDKLLTFAPSTPVEEARVCVGFSRFRYDSALMIKKQAEQLYWCICVVPAHTPAA